MHPSLPHPVTGIGQPSCLYTSDTRILEANGPAEVFAGHPLAGLCLAELAALFAPRALDGTRLSITRLPARRALGDEVVIETSIAIRATDGRIITFLVTATPLSDGANVGGALEIRQPDDGRCQLSVPEPVLADAPRPPGMIVLLDADGTILDLDDAFAGIFGRPALELVGANAWRVFPIVPGARIRERSLRAFASGRPHHFEEVLDGLLFEGLVLPVRSAAGTVDQAVIVLRDVTGRRRSEEALRESEEPLRLGQESAEVETWDWIPATGAITFTSEFLLYYGVRARPSATTQPGGGSSIRTRSSVSRPSATRRSPGTSRSGSSTASSRRRARFDGSP